MAYAFGLELAKIHAAKDIEGNGIGDQLVPCNANFFVGWNKRSGSTGDWWMRFASSTLQ